MTNTEYKQYLQSGHWLETKEKIMKRDNYTCVMCESKNNLCVHHKTYKNLWHEKDEDLVTLCRGCHYRIHKSNYDLSYVQYVRNEKFEIALQKQMEDYKIFNDFVENHIDEFKYIIDILDKQNYIDRKVFNNIVRQINPTFDRTHFNFFCMGFS